MIQERKAKRFTRPNNSGDNVTAPLILNDKANLTTAKEENGPDRLPGFPNLGSTREDPQRSESLGQIAEHHIVSAVSCFLREQLLCSQEPTFVR
jgi:hypothetical protein